MNEGRAAAKVRVAVAQFDYQPCATLNYPYLEEPVLLAEGEDGITSLQLTLPQARERLMELRKEISAAHEDHLSNRLVSIVTDLNRREADLIVFPEYSVPASSLTAIDRVAGRSNVVAGSHTVTASSLPVLQSLGITCNGADIGRAICPVRLADGKWQRIDKLSKSRWEAALKPGTSWSPVFTQTRSGVEVRFAVFLCVDFINELDQHFQRVVPRDIWDQIDFAVVPSYSPTVRDFDQKARAVAERAGRPILYSNVSTIGGSRIYCNFPDTGPFTERSGTKALASRDDAVILVDLALGSYAQFSHQPSPLPTPEASELIGVLPIVAGDALPEYVRIHADLAALVNEEAKRSRIQAARDGLTRIASSTDVPPIIRTKLFTLLGAVDWKDGAWIDGTLDAIFLPAGTPILDEARFELLYKTQSFLAGLVTDARLRGTELDTVATALDVYRRAIDALRPRVHPDVSRRYDPTTLAIHTVRTDVSATSGFTSLFLMTLRSARIHRESLEKQIKLISTLAYEANTNLALNLRYVSLPNPGGNLKALGIQIIGAAQADDRDGSRKLADDFRRDVSNLMRVTLRDAYTFQLLETDASDLAKNAEPFPLRHVAELYRQIHWGMPPYVDTASAPRIHHLVASSTMARILDTLQSSPFACLLSVHLQPITLSEAEGSFFKTYKRSSAVAPLQSEGAMFFLGTERHPDLHLEHALTYQRMLGDTQGLTPGLLVRLFVASDEPIPMLLLNTIGHDLWGNDTYRIAQPTGDAASYIIDAIKQGLAPQTAEHVNAMSALERVPFLFDAYEASRIFRLPLEGYSGAVGTLFAVIPAPAAALPDEGIEVGLGFHSGAQKPIVVRLTESERSKHTYIVGKTGTGKSTLLARMIEQDIQSGHGVCVIDPHGDLVDSVLARVPRARAEDVVLIDPADTESPFGLNLLEFNPALPHNKEFVVQDTITIMRKLFYHEWSGPVFEHNLRHLILTMLDESMEGQGTLIEVPRPLYDREFRDAIIPRLRDEFARDFWKQYEQISSSSLGDNLFYVVSKFDTFVIDRIMRNIIGRAKSTINVSDIVANRRILLVKLPSALIGEINAALLGMIILSKLRLAGMARAAVPPSERTPYYVYVDEFQNFAASGFETILAEARKYGIGLVLAHQHLGQLSAFNVSSGRTEDRALQAIFGNAATMIAFRVGVQDAKFLSQEMGAPVDHDDLENLKNYHAIMRTLIDDEVYPAFTIRTIPMSPPSDPSVTAEIRQRSTRVYGRNRELVEEEIRERLRFIKSGTRVIKTPPPVLSTRDAVTEPQVS